MTYGLIKYDWSIQSDPVSVDVSGKAYISLWPFKGWMLYFLYTAEGRFIDSYWSESEARLAAAARGLDCESKLRSYLSPGIGDRSDQTTPFTTGIIL